VTGLRAVALGGGHGLAASLRALRRVADDLTAIVTVADDGGSSGRLRRDFGVLPPGDLRMALAALCGDDEWGTTWSRVVQHRFGGDRDLAGHAVGNLLIVALWDLLGDTVAGLDWVGRLLGTGGRVLPMAALPLDIVAEVVGADPDKPDEVTTIRGQQECATTPGQVRSITLLPEDPPAVPEAVRAVLDADWIVFGPGSWFTSVLPHLLVPELATALHVTTARRLLVLNLAPQPGETAGFSPHKHLEVLAGHAPAMWSWPIARRRTPITWPTWRGRRPRSAPGLSGPTWPRRMARPVMIRGCWPRRTQRFSRGSGGPRALFPRHGTAGGILALREPDGPDR
jgi:uncharacterized cofD-like protein